MSRANSIANDPSLASLSGVMGLSRQPLTPEQQMQALKRVQSQAEQRVKLGMQLFKAAEARLSGQTDVLQQIKTLQKQLKEQVNNDVAQTLHQYDQWIGQIDESFTTAIRKLEEKIDAVQANVNKSESQMRHMLERAEALLDQSRQMLERQSLKPTGPPTIPDMVKDTPSASVYVDPFTAKPVTPSKPTQPKQPPARNADTDLNFTAPPKPAKPAPEAAPKVAPEVAPESAPKPVAEVPPVVSSDISHIDVPDHDASHEEKIYSKLLQRLIEENRSAEADRNDAAKREQDDKDGHADAA